MPGTSDDSAADSRLAERLTEIAVRACAEILGVDFRDAGARLKADNSPVTRADEAAHAAIMERAGPGGARRSGNLRGSRGAMARPLAAG